jgi:signal peptidase II
LKIWVKVSMEYGDEFKIMGLEWARIHFVENEGMAFGISIGGNTGKLLLSLFRIFAVGFLIFIIYKLVRSKESSGLLVCFSLILAGAIGNILDSAFYGLLFTESYYQGGLAQYAPGKGYAPFLFGRVVDMFYFPLVDTYWPSWMPFVGGQPFQFFRPVFNVADTAISTGVISLLVFFRSFFKNQNNPEPIKKESEPVTEVIQTEEVSQPVSESLTDDSALIPEPNKPSQE